MKNSVRSFCAISVLLGACPGAWAEEPVMELEEVVVTGARGKPRTVSDSPVPIDVFNAEAIQAVSYTDTNDVLKTLVPSYNVGRQPISDGGSFIRPAQLRGMPTDKTLVLVNSKRRHRAALVTIGGSGTQGPDIATIPSSALKNVEVLRDGAAAQYGSDAIAGVINFILKDNSEGGSLSLNAGEFYEGDGFDTTMTGNIGFSLGENGFFSLSGEYSKSDFTSRSEQYCTSDFCLDTNNPVYDPSASYTVFTEDPAFQAAAKNASLEGDVVQPWGQPNSEALRLFFNSGYQITDTLEAYAYGNYSESEADGSFYYRYPLNGTLNPLRLEDGSIYDPLEVFPGGFTPRFFGEVTDYSFLGGLKGEIGSGIFWDVSARYGYNEISYTLKNTINPSMGPDSPTSFKPGDLSNEEIQIQADLSQEVDMGLSNPVLLAYGASYMEETYELVGGDPDSYEAGPHSLSDPYGFCSGGSATAAGLAVIGNGSSLDCADEDDPVYRVVGVGSNGFPGYSPEYSGEYKRDSYAAYIDLSTDLTDKLFIQTAARYEDYSDFGDELVGKLSFKYSLTDSINLRGSVGTGFRAPTPGQQGTTNVSTRLPNGFPVATGLFPASSTVAQALGAEDLTPETSTNYSLGMSMDFDKLSLTVDFYRIDIADRTYAVSTRDVSTDPTSGEAYDNYLAMSNAGVVGAESIGGVFYFANAFDSITTGMDIVATYPLTWADDSETLITASLNYNKSELDSDVTGILNEEDAFDFENLNPEWRGVVSAVHDFGPISLTGRANIYGSYENFNAGEVQKYDPMVTIDLEAIYRVNEAMSVVLGGRNIFDEYPEKDKIGDMCCGALYLEDTAVDWQGGYYYMSLRYDY